MVGRGGVGGGSGYNYDRDASEPVWPSGKALGWQTNDVESSPLFGSPFSSNVVIECLNLSLAN